MQYAHFNRRVDLVHLASPLWAKLDFTKKSLRGFSAAQKAGLRYERTVIEYLYSNEPGFISHLPFKFYSSTEAGKAIPDGLIFNFSTKTITIVEIKFRHSLEPWKQLTEFYKPIVKKAYEGFTVNLLEVCKAYDPGVKLPGYFKVTNNFSQLNFKAKEPYTVFIYSTRV